MALTTSTTSTTTSTTILLLLQLLPHVDFHLFSTAASNEHALLLTKRLLLQSNTALSNATGTLRCVWIDAATSASMHSRGTNLELLVVDQDLVEEGEYVLLLARVR